MGQANLQTVAYASPGGEACPPSRTRPVDLVHLARQTLGDRDLEREVLALFVQQATMVRERISAANASERKFLAHGLRGSAAGIGAFAVAKTASEIEHDPDADSLLLHLAARIDEVRDFIASISR
ncbi:MAG: histidine kinase [Mesorhizobium sp.]|nr:Hpt domain-containing protein [Mesorhizobium sp.]MCO5163467.1 histidine kinase [Mesorhizobium sp.]